MVDGKLVYKWIDGGVMSHFALTLLQAFGFCNLVLWAGNLWFVIKETGWLSAVTGTYVPSGGKQPAPDSYDQGE